MIRTVLIHNPRTAGTSMRKYIESQTDSWQDFSRSGKCEAFTPDKDFTCFGHRSIRALERRGVVDREWYNQCFRFVFVRNTWDRLVSVYEYLRSFRLTRNSCRKTNHHLVDFPTWIREITRLDRRNVPPPGAIVTRPHFPQAGPQTQWLEWEHNFMGRYEHLESDWETVCRMMEIPHAPLPSHNVSRRKDYRDYYTDELVELVKSAYGKEIKKLGYYWEV